VRAELFDFQPFGGVPSVLLCGVSRHPRRTLGGIGPAFVALESDNDPDALVFGHKGRCAAVAKRSDKLKSYKVAYFLCVSLQSLRRICGYL